MTASRDQSNNSHAGSKSDALNARERRTADAAPRAASSPHSSTTSGAANAASTASTQATSSGAPAGTDEWVVVGEFVGPFGIHGEIKLRPLTDFPERFEHTPTIYVGKQHTPYRVEQAHMHKQLVLVRLAGIADVDAAEHLRGEQIWIPASELTPLQEGQFYLHDVVGLRVRHVNGQALGVVTDVVSTGASELFVIRDPQGKEVLLPVVKSFVKQIDFAQGVILVDPIPGLFDEDYEEAP